MSRYLLEVCVDSVESAQNACRGGADRLELCADLLVGGTSPTPALIRAVQNNVNIPIRVLLRPRFGDFCYTPCEKAILLEELAEVRQMGAAGAVIGALTPDGALDAAFLAQCRAAAGTMPLTLHRAFDVCADPFAALAEAARLGFDTVLTSGQQADACAGAPLLAELVGAAPASVTVLVGSGVTPDNIGELAEKTGAHAFHFSARKAQPSPMRLRRDGVPMGLPLADEFTRWYADEAAVRAARAKLNACR